MVFLSGKLYYDLEKERSERKVDSVALIRIEVIIIVGHYNSPFNCYYRSYVRFPSRPSRQRFKSTSLHGRLYGARKSP